jgi:phosphopentomutase
MAAYEQIIPVPQLYRLCEIARAMLQGEHGVGRVIARPFVGDPGGFVRTANRRDFSLPPHGETILDVMTAQGLKTYAVGKIWDLFAERGMTDHVKISNNTEGMDRTLELARNDTEYALIFANLVDFDQTWGHRRDPENFARALEEFDQQLGGLLEELRSDDLLIITADHGCDPTFVKHTDHTREYVPLLVYGDHVKAGVDLGTRETFADVASTLAEVFGLEHKFAGRSFLEDLES